MPRQARSTPFRTSSRTSAGRLHHVILRGIEERATVSHAADREQFVARLGAVATATGTAICAWALLPNYAHLLLRSGPTGLPKFMMRLPTGYAIRYNRRHHRHGRLFQNRYKSIVYDEDELRAKVPGTFSQMRPEGRSADDADGADSGIGPGDARHVAVGISAPSADCPLPTAYWPPFPLDRERRQA